MDIYTNEFRGGDLNITVDPNYHDPVRGMLLVDKLSEHTIQGTLIDSSRIYSLYFWAYFYVVNEPMTLFCITMRSDIDVTGTDDMLRT